MSDGMMLIINDDGKAEIYDDTYDITIHCTSEEEKNEVIEHLNSMRWIPCSERLPEEDGTYIVSGIWGSGKEQVGECEYLVEDGYFRTAWNFDVKAWMPLPKPWKGDAE